MADIITKDVLTLDEIKTVIGQEKKAMVIYDVSTGEPNGLDVEVLIGMDSSISTLMSNQSQLSEEIIGYNTALGGIAYNAAAPTPGKSGYYDFISAGTKPAWLTGSVTDVEIGDRVIVVYANSAYTYTYQANPNANYVTDYNVTIGVPLTVGNYYTLTYLFIPFLTVNLFLYLYILN